MGDASEGVTDFEDYYDLLGVDPDADEAAILRAYRRAVKEYHPDRREAAALDTDTAAAVFKHLSAARSILTVPARRAEYDRLGHRTYLLRHDGDEEAVSPGASDDDPRETATEDGRGAWYAATTPAPETATEEPAAAGVAAGSVVEGSDLGVADLLGSDPLETAWRRFLAVWTVRILAVGGGIVAAVTLTSPAVAAVPSSRWSPSRAWPRW
ncbi:DnaJ domain-containing protein, partial [Halapricum sp. CBA1109]|uniref:J domain-containing protein n=1 Tax=Halapricum sp. CBA1109 TaxID=2668068 RepID=UPI0012F8FD7E